MWLVFLSGKVVKRDAVEFRKHLYLYYATERVYVNEKGTVDDFLLNVACGTSFLSVQQ
jgi:hypothetical protein